MIAIRPLTKLLTYFIVVCGILPLFQWLTTVPKAILVFGLLYGVITDQKRLWQLKPWLQNFAIVPFFLFYVLQFSRANPVQPVVSVLAIMMAVRLGGEKSVRHTLQIYALSIFCLAAYSLFDLSPLFLVYLGVLLFSIALALVLLTFQDQNDAMTVSKQDLKRILLSAMLMPLLAVPLLLIIFPIMPRTQKPLWNFIAQSQYRTTGYSETVEPGGQSSVVSSKKLVFRVEMPRVEPSRLYWRATVFNRTDGNRWTRTHQVPEERTILRGLKTHQIIYPEPASTRTLVALDRPTLLTSSSFIKKTPDGVFELSGRAGKRSSYNAYSYITGDVFQRNQIDSHFYLQLPDNLPLKIKALAEKIKHSAKSDGEKIEALESYYRKGAFRYSTKDLVTGDMALEKFIFETKSGNCEFFASSFAILLRSAGVPCRLVGGYLGGEYNELGGYYSIVDDRAHVWVEVFIGGTGWKRIDPSGFASNSTEALATLAGNLASRLAMAVDSLNHIWNRTVISYDFERQINMLSRAGERLHDISPYGVILKILPYGMIVLLAAAIISVLRMKLYFKSREHSSVRLDNCITGLFFKM